MEGVAVFSLLCNVLQVVETSRNIVASVREIQSSINGSTTENEELHLINRQLQKDAETVLQIKDEPTLHDVARRCGKLSSEHLAMLDTMRLRKGAGIFQAIWMAIKVRYRKRALEESQARLDRLSFEITKHIITTRIPRMDLALQSLSARQHAFDERTTQTLDMMRQKLSTVNNLIGDNVRAAESTRSSVKILQEYIDKTEQQQKYRQCIHALYFDQLKSREDEVKKAHKKTFGWIFEEQTGEVKSKFCAWLHSNIAEENVFWVSGKPGAGKSTLMKFLAHHSRLKEHLRPWAKHRPVLIVEYYFWRIGSPLQRSMRGLLQSLLFQILKEYPDLTAEAFPEQEWALAGAQYKFPMESLHRAMRKIRERANDLDLRFFFLVDGLDEFDDRSELHENLDEEGINVRKLLDFLQIFYDSPVIKLCVSSRP